VEQSRDVIFLVADFRANKIKATTFGPRKLPQKNYGARRQQNDKPGKEILPPPPRQNRRKVKFFVIGVVGLVVLVAVNNYEMNTGKVIAETFRNPPPLQHPAVLVASHGPFTWGKDIANTVHNANILEFVSRLASETLRINPKIPPMQSVLLGKHFLRKHGADAYYGQK